MQSQNKNNIKKIINKYNGVRKTLFSLFKPKENQEKIKEIESKYDENEELDKITYRILYKNI